MNSFKNRDIVSLRDMSVDDLWTIVKKAGEIKAGKHQKCLENKTIASVYFEPSTRTRLSFESAILKSGGNVFGFADPGTASQKKGESFSDSIRTVTGYCDAMVIRHPVEGAARLATEVASVPVINAGDGANQHPTQTFLDLFTIYEEFGRLKNLTISYVIPQKWAEATRIFKPFRIYAQGQNLVTWTKYQGFDPETDGAYEVGLYPHVKTITFGIDAGF